MHNRYLEKIAGLPGLNVFKSGITNPAIFNTLGRAIEKKPVGGIVKANTGLTLHNQKLGVKSI
jgi:hypothetical protein